MTFFFEHFFNHNNVRGRENTPNILNIKCLNKSKIFFQKKCRKLILNNS